MQEKPRGSGAKKHLAGHTLALAYVALLLAAAWARRGGLNPGTLWFDDVWVAVLTKSSSIFSLAAIPTSEPLGFVAALWIVRRLISDPEVSLQIMPFLCGLAAIPLVGVATTKVTGSRGMGLLAAALVALNPEMSQFSVFVKHFNLDAVATGALLLVSAASFSEPPKMSPARVAAGGVIFFLFSYASILSSFLIVNLRAGFAVLESAGRRERWPPAVRAALAYDTALVGFYLLFLRRVRNPALNAYWSDYYPNSASLRDVYDFIVVRGKDAISGALPGVLERFWVLAVIGLVWLFWKPERRRLAVFFALFYLQWGVLSGLGVYPMGTGRTDIFSYPVTIALVCCGLRALTAPLATLTSPGGRRRAELAVGFAAVVWALVLPPSVAYFDVEGDADFVRQLQGRMRAGDALLVYPRVSYLVGYYSDWPVALSTTDDIPSGVDVQLRRPNTVTLPHRSTEVAVRTLDSFLRARRNERVFYASGRVRDTVIPDAFTLAAFEHYDYRLRDTIASGRSRAYLFERSGVASEYRLPESFLVPMGERGDERFLGDGWSSREDDGLSFRWATGASSSLVVPLRAPELLATDEIAAGYVVQFRGRPFSWDGSPTQTIDVEVDAELVARLDLEDGMQEYSVRIPAEVVQRTFSEIRFRYGHSMRPRDVGEGNDPRRLAVLFDWVRIVRDDQRR